MSVDDGCLLLLLFVMFITQKDNTGNRSHGGQEPLGNKCPTLDFFEVKDAPQARHKNTGLHQGISNAFAEVIDRKEGEEIANTPQQTACTTGQPHGAEMKGRQLPVSCGGRTMFLTAIQES